MRQRQFRSWWDNDDSTPAAASHGSLDLYDDTNAGYDREIDAGYPAIKPLVTWGISPGDGIGIVPSARIDEAGAS